MSALSNEERIKILSDIVAIKTVNDNELEVENLQTWFDKYGIESELDEVSEGRANLNRYNWFRQTSDWHLRSHGCDR